MLTVGLLLNPVAGIGGAAGLKGSDGLAAQQAAESGYTSPVIPRTLRFLNSMRPWRDRIRLVTCSGSMGEDACKAAGCSVDELISIPHTTTTGDDTTYAVQQMRKMAVDLLVFAGGDGTARDVLHAAGKDLPVLGLPSGVKMQSGVFGIHPEATAELVRQLVDGELVNLGVSEVRDIDESALRNGEVRSRYFGELITPQCHQYLQSVKCGGIEDQALVQEEIAAFIEDEFEPETTYLVGAGTTTQAIKARLLPDGGTLLGVDILSPTAVVPDVDEKGILQALSCASEVKLVLSFTGGQGYLFGRGNQQFSVDVLRQVANHQISVVGSRTKLSALGGRPLHVDTGCPELDKRLSGLWPICVGYDDFVMYPVSH